MGGRAQNQVTFQSERHTVRCEHHRILYDDLRNFLISDDELMKYSLARRYSRCAVGQVPYVEEGAPNGILKSKEILYVSIVLENIYFIERYIETNSHRAFKGRSAH